MPDIEKELFSYLLERIEVLEDAIESGKVNIEKEKDIELRHKNYVDSMKD